MKKYVRNKKTNFLKHYSGWEHIKIKLPIFLSLLKIISKPLMAKGDFAKNMPL